MPVTLLPAYKATHTLALWVPTVEGAQACPCSRSGNNTSASRGLLNLYLYARVLLIVVSVSVQLYHLAVVSPCQPVQAV